MVQLKKYRGSIQFLMSKKKKKRSKVQFLSQAFAWNLRRLGEYLTCNGFMNENLVREKFREIFFTNF